MEIEEEVLREEYPDNEIYKCRCGQLLIECYFIYPEGIGNLGISEQEVTEYFYVCPRTFEEFDNCPNCGVSLE